MVSSTVGSLIWSCTIPLQGPLLKLVYTADISSGNVQSVFLALPCIEDTGPVNLE